MKLYRTPKAALEASKLQAEQDRAESEAMRVGMPGSIKRTMGGGHTWNSWSRVRLDARDFRLARRNYPDVQFNLD